MTDGNELVQDILEGSRKWDQVTCREVQLDVTDAVRIALHLSYLGWVKEG